jgi:hypothetical protein
VIREPNTVRIDPSTLTRVPEVFLTVAVPRRMVRAPRSPAGSSVTNTLRLAGAVVGT